MSVEILVALIGSIGTLIGVIITVRNGNSKTLYRLDLLEKKQDKHNSLIERTFKIEDRLNVIDERIKVANNRIKDLEDRK